MITVHLRDIQLFGKHGVYSGEATTGNEYEIQLQVKYKEAKRKFDNLENVLDYEELHNIVKKQMAIPTALLEELAQKIISEVYQKYSYIKMVNISIFKLQAPIEGFKGKVGITLQKKFNQ